MHHETEEKVVFAGPWRHLGRERKSLHLHKRTEIEHSFLIVSMYT